MEVKITQQKENALLARKDVLFLVSHAGETTPSRVQVRQLVASELGTKTENVVIDRMQSEYGIGSTKGVARAYKSVDAARSYERVHLLKRNQLHVEKPAKGPKAEKGEKGAEAAAEKPAAAKPAAEKPAAKAAEKAPAAKPAEKAAEKPAAKKEA